MDSGTRSLHLRHTVPKPGIHAVHAFFVKEASDTSPDDPSRAEFSVEYDARRDRLELNVRGEQARVRFGVLRVMPSWRGNDYEVRLFPLGKVDIRRGKVVLLEGQLTGDGLELKSRTPRPELEPLVPALAIGLLVRRQDHRSH